MKLFFIFRFAILACLPLALCMPGAAQAPEFASTTAPGVATIIHFGAALPLNAQQYSEFILTSGSTPVLYICNANPCAASGNWVAAAGPGSAIWNAIGSPSAAATIAMGAFGTTFNFTGSQIFDWANTTAVSVYGAQDSPVLELQANYWNGTASAVDTWQMFSAVRSGTINPGTILYLVHASGSTGLTAVSVPNLIDAGVISAGYLATDSTGKLIAASAPGGGNTTSTTLTATYVPKANGANSIINSSIKDNGTNVNISEPVVVNVPTAPNALVATCSTVALPTLTSGSSGWGFDTIANGCGYMTNINGAGWVASSADGPGGNILEFNGTALASTDRVNFSSTNPAAPTGSLNVVLQKLTASSLGNVTDMLSGYVPPFVASGTSHAPGLVPDPGSTAGSTRYLREDGTWNTPSGGGGDTITTPNETLAVGGTSSATSLDLVGATGEIMAGATPALTANPTLGLSGTTGSVTLIYTNGTTSNTITENATGLTVGTVTSGVWNGTALTSAYLPSATAYTGTAQTWTALQTFGTNISIAGAAAVANMTIVLGNSGSSTSWTANSCLNATAGSTTPSTVSMTNLATTSVVTLTPVGNTSAIPGFGTSGGLTIAAWPSGAGTLSYLVCNQSGTAVSWTSSTGTSGTFTFNVGAK